MYIKCNVLIPVADFGLHELRETAEHLSNDTLEVYKKLWCAPELLREKGPARGTQKGDVYSFGIILYEIYGRSGPYGEEQTTASEIIKMVTYPDGQLKRPDIELLRTIAADMDTGKVFLINAASSCLYGHLRKGSGGQVDPSLST